MEKKRTKKFWGGLAVIAALVLMAGSFAVAKISAPTATTLAVAIPDGELDPAVWGKAYPKEYSSYLQNDTSTKGNSKYGGSAPFSHLKEDPLQVKLFAGNAFSTDYNEDRGHTYAIKDILKSKRVTDKTTASCWTCKSPNAVKMIEEQGDAFYSQSFKALTDKMVYSISCADCHDSKTMALKITRPAFIEALKRQGKDPEKLTQQEMRSAVCGQCHAEYYFKAENKKVVFPWDNGLKVEDIEKYYDNIKFSDFTHADSKASILKAQHPDYEMYSTGIHAANNVACADCHMPYIKEGSTKISSHHWQSPLNNISQSCGACHNQSEDYLKNQVLDIQDKVHDTKLTSEKAIVDAIDWIKKAGAEPTANAQLLSEARELHRQAQWRWDFVSAENSMGFHSPTEALRILGEATDLGHKAEAKARSAVNQ